MTPTGIGYRPVDQDYFDQRGLRRYAGVASLWALGVGAVISGHYSGWNLGLLAGGWGGFALATGGDRRHVSRPRLLHRRDGRGAAAHRWRLFLRACLDGAVGRLHHRPLRERRIRADARRRRVLPRHLSRRRVRDAAGLAAALLDRGLCACSSASTSGASNSPSRSPWSSRSPRWPASPCSGSRPSPSPSSDALRSTSAPGPTASRSNCRPVTARCCRSACTARFAALPFAVWLFLAIEQLPLAAEELVDPSRDMPRGIIAGLLTLFVSAALILWLNPSVAPGSFKLGASGEPLLDGFRATFGERARQGAGAGRLRRPDRLLPHHPVRQGPADLFAVARRLLPAFPVDHPSAPQDAARRPARGLGRGARDHVRRCGSAWRIGARERRGGDPGHAAQHGGRRRHALLPPAGRELHRAAPSGGPPSNGPTARRLGSRVRSSRSCSPS